MRRRYKSRTGIVVITFVVLILFGTVAYARVSLEEKSNNSKNKIEELNAKIDEQTERALDIENQKKYVQTKQYIEDIAREKLGLVYEDEIIFEPEE